MASKQTRYDYYYSSCLRNLFGGGKMERRFKKIQRERLEEWRELGRISRQSSLGSKSSRALKGFRRLWGQRDIEKDITASIRWWNTVICTVSIAADESAFTNYIRTCSSISIYSLAMLACNSLVRVGRTARGIIVHEDPSYLRSFCHLCFIFSASNLAGRVTFFGRWTFIGETSFSATLSIYSGNC